MPRFDRAFYVILTLILMCGVATAVTENFNTFFSGLVGASQPLQSGDKLIVLQGGVDKFLAGNLMVDTTSSQTITGKTLNGTNNTLTVLAATQLSGAAPAANGGTGLSSGTSGGVLCATGATTYAFSAALTANAPVIGGGAGACPGSGSFSGNQTKAASVSGSITSGAGVVGDANGNIVSSTNVALLNTAQTWTGQQTFGSTLATQNTQPGTTYTFATTDCGIFVKFTSSSPVVATAPATLPVNCPLTIVQVGAGRVSIPNGGTGNATYTSPLGYTGTFGPGAAISLLITDNPGGSAAAGVLNGTGS